MFQNWKGTRAEFCQNSWCSSPTSRVRPMAGHRPPTTEESRRFRHHICNCRIRFIGGFATITWGSRGTLSSADCTVDCTAHCLTNELLKAPFTNWHGSTEEGGIRYVLFHCLFAYKSVLHLVRLGSSGLKVSEIILGCICPMVLPNGEIGFYQRENRLKHIKAA